jgi:hypothetical protein
MNTDDLNELDYDSFMDLYHKNHEVCPKCGCANGIETLMGYILDESNKEAYKDLNNFTCAECGTSCTVHEKVSKRMYDNINTRRNTLRMAIDDLLKEHIKGGDLNINYGFGHNTFASDIDSIKHLNGLNYVACVVFPKDPVIQEAYYTFLKVMNNQIIKTI